ncbi:MAG: Holliday junction branch migration DNA helicase RuvB, partial [Chloroflexota bacterium]|nr:Holliday junction branch migration DNA helicase RuvB [Chloroflexota bacterium]
LQLGFLDRTPRGRKATPLAYKHLGIPPKDKISIHQVGLWQNT